MKKTERKLPEITQQSILHGAIDFVRTSIIPDVATFLSILGFSSDGVYRDWEKKIRKKKMG